MSFYFYEIIDRFPKVSHIKEQVLITSQKKISLLSSIFTSKYDKYIVHIPNAVPRDQIIYLWKVKFLLTFRLEFATAPNLALLNKTNSYIYSMRINTSHAICPPRAVKLRCQLGNVVRHLEYLYCIRAEKSKRPDLNYKILVTVVRKGLAG